MKRKKVTLRDIAKHSGFSISTISHVINGTRFVEEKTKEAILEAIDSLGYEKGANSSVKQQFIGVIIPDIRVNYFTELLKYLESSFSSNNYHVLYFDSEENPQTEQELFHKLIELQVAGIVIAPSDCYARLPETDIPTVCIDRKVCQSPCVFISIDHFRSAYQATVFLLEQGIGKAGFVGFTDRNFTSSERKRGFEFAIQQKAEAVTCTSYLVDYHELKCSHGFDDFLQELAPQGGILASSSNLAFKIVGACRRLGLRIPEDIKLAAYDNDKWFDFLSVPIAAIDQPVGDIAMVTMERLISMIENPAQNIPQDILLPYQFIERM